MKIPVIVVSLLLSVPSAFGSNPPASYVRLWLDAEIAQNWNVLGSYYWYSDPTDPLTISTLELAVFSSDYQQSSIAPIDLQNDMLFEAGYRGGAGFNLADENLSHLGLGVFRVALISNGHRLSNIVTLKIQTRAPIFSGPLIQVLGISDPSKPAISALGLWIIPPDQIDPGLTSETLTKLTLIVDGVNRALHTTPMNGHPGPLQPHKCYAGLIDLSDYGPPIESKSSHEVQVIIGQDRFQIFGFPHRTFYTSPLTTVSVNTALEQQFDAHLAKLLSQ
jgi:hypothetical protein